MMTTTNATMVDAITKFFRNGMGERREVEGGRRKRGGGGGRKGRK